MTPEALYATVQAMTRYGGSFVRQLAELVRLADDDNRARLLQAFPEYFERYRQRAEADTV